jgi:hypothetical protein
MKSNRAILGVALAAAMLVAFAAPAAARAGDVTRPGSCSGTAHWTFKGGLRDGLIEVEFEVDSNRVGQSWRVRLSDNGTTFFHGPRKTLAPSGSFTVHATTANRVGSDRISGLARDVASGQTCSAVITVG